MRKKTMMLFFALAVSSVSAWAQTTTASCVVVEETNGNKTECDGTCEQDLIFVKLLKIFHDDSPFLFDFSVFIFVGNEQDA